MQWKVFAWSKKYSIVINRIVQAKVIFNVNLNNVPQNGEFGEINFLCEDP